MRFEGLELIALSQEEQRGSGLKCQQSPEPSLLWDDDLQNTGGTWHGVTGRKRTKPMEPGLGIRGQVVGGKRGTSSTHRHQSQLQAQRQGQLYRKQQLCIQGRGKEKNSGKRKKEIKTKPS